MTVTPPSILILLLFFFNDTATTEIYTLPLHDALPICSLLGFARARRGPRARLPHAAGRRRARRPHSDAGVPGRTASHVPLRSEEHTSELQSQSNLVCRLLLEKKNKSSTPLFVMYLMEH